ncbi:hypothetical protein ACVI1L_000463 [Bradyrhizobium sp. USDA 4516]
MAAIVLQLDATVLHVLAIVLHLAAIVLQLEATVLHFAETVLQVAAMVLQLPEIVLQLAAIVLQVAAIVLQVAAIVLQLAAIVPANFSGLRSSTPLSRSSPIGFSGRFTPISSSSTSRNAASLQARAKRRLGMSGSASPETCPSFKTRSPPKVQRVKLRSPINCGTSRLPYNASALCDLATSSNGVPVIASL